MNDSAVVAMVLGLLLAAIAGATLGATVTAALANRFADQALQCMEGGLTREQCREVLNIQLN